MAGCRLRSSFRPMPDVSSGGAGDIRAVPIRPRSDHSDTPSLPRLDIIGRGLYDKLIREIVPSARSAEYSTNARTIRARQMKPTAYPENSLIRGNNSLF